MWRYLSAAFWARADLPGLGRIPVNAVLCAGVACLGFAIPGVWLIGLGIETAYLFALATSPRFRTVLDAQEQSRLHGAAGDERVAARRNLEHSLPPEAVARLRGLEARCARVLDLQRAGQNETFIIDSNREALERLTWAHLKLLIAQANLGRLAHDGSDGRLHQQTQALVTELDSPALTEAVRASKQATLAILRKRLDNLARREQLLAEIASDLERIEAQVDLAIENAAMPAGTGRVGFDLELAGHILDSSLFGAAEAAVGELDKSYSGRRPVPVTG